MYTLNNILQVLPKNNLSFTRVYFEVVIISINKFNTQSAKSIMRLM